LLSINSKDRTIEMSVDGMNLEFEMHYDVSSDPNWLQDSGKATVSINNARIKMNLLPRASKDGVL